jgi:TonB family protein
VFEQLVASVRPGQRPLRSTLAAVALHLGVVAVAVVTTRDAVRATPARPAFESPLPYLPATRPPRPAPSDPGGSSGGPAALAVPEPPRFDAPVGIPTIAPGPWDAPPPRGVRPDGNLGILGRGDGVGALPPGVAHTGEEVDEQVRRLDGPAPRYPEAMRQSGIEGKVQILMIVDTLGRVETGSVHVLASTDPRFEAPALAAVAASRYAPARLAGRPVRQLVMQAVRFRLNDAP